MKKMAILGALLVLMASSASAESVKFTDDDAGKSLGATAPADNVIGKTSKGVKVQIIFDETGGTAYALQTVHLSGSKIYGTGYDSTAIKVKTPDGVAKDIFDANELTSSVSATAFADGWSDL